MTLASLKRLFGLGDQYMIAQRASRSNYESQPMLVWRAENNHASLVSEPSDTILPVTSPQ